jgi:predicted amino acid-binding ACT domain protein
VVALGGYGWDAALRALRALGWQVPRPRPRFGHVDEVLLPGAARDVVLLGSYHPSQQNTFTVREVPEEQAPEDRGSAWVLTVHGGDRTGIVSAIADEVARVGGNITDLTTRLAGELYLLVAEIDLPAGTDAAALRAAIGTAASSLGVVATLREAEADEL